MGSAAVDHPYSCLRTCYFVVIILAVASITTDRHPCSFRQTCCFTAGAAAITVSPCLILQTCWICIEQINHVIRLSWWFCLRLHWTCSFSNLDTPNLSCGLRCFWKLLVLLCLSLSLSSCLWWLLLFLFVGAFFRRFITIFIWVSHFRVWRGFLLPGLLFLVFSWLLLYITLLSFGLFVLFVLMGCNSSCALAFGIRIVWCIELTLLVVAKSSNVFTSEATIFIAAWWASWATTYTLRNIEIWSAPSHTWLISNCAL